MIKAHWVNLSFILSIVLLCLLYRKQFLNAFNLYQWRKKLKIKTHQKTFDVLYKNVNGFALSKSARQNNDSIELLYGEINFESFIALLSCCEINEQTRFYDLGSGTGKAVIATALVYPIKKAVGIERLETLYNCANQLKQKLIRETRDDSFAQRIEFIYSDFFLCDLEKADLVFINATAFIGDAWTKVASHLQQLKKNSRCISISKKLPAKEFKLELETRVEMSWGIAFAYIHRKR